MAVESPQQKFSIATAAANYSSTAGLAGPNGSGQFLVVKLTGTGTAPTVTVTSASADVCVGILQNDPIAGAGADVCFSGVSKVVAGAAFAIGIPLMSNSSAGTVITATGTNPVIGYAMGQATAANQIVSMLVVPSMTFS